jgi:hypothetical protein
MLMDYSSPVAFFPETSLEHRFVAFQFRWVTNRSESFILLDFQTLSHKGTRKASTLRIMRVLSIVDIMNVLWIPFPSTAFHSSHLLVFVVAGDEITETEYS